MSRLTQYLYVNEQLALSVPLSVGGAASTITWKLCETDAGTPSAIGTLTVTSNSTSGSPPAYTGSWSSSTLRTQLAGYIGRRVYLHQSSTTTDAYEVYPYLVTDRDPDLLPQLLT